MRTPAALLAIPVAALIVASCGGDDSRAADTAGSSAPTITTTTPATPSTTVPATTVATTPATDAGPTTTADDGIVDISVVVGTDSGPDRSEQVPVGSTVRLTIVNPAADDEFHLHDYDLGDDRVVPAGEEAVFLFTADRVGSFELESHETETVLMVLQVV